MFFLSEDKSSMKQLLHATATPLGEPEAFKLSRVAMFVISELGAIQRDSLGRHGHVLRSLQPLSSAAQLWKLYSGDLQCKMWTPTQGWMKSKSRCPKTIGSSNIVK